MKTSILLLVSGITLALGTVANGEIRIIADRNQDDASPGFKFKNVPPPAKGDAAARASFVIVEGERDGNGGSVDRLNDGRVASDEDEPSASFFFNAGTDGGRLLVDLGDTIEIKQINTYSWHSNTRGPQVYRLYASDGKADGFAAQPKKGTDLAKTGWEHVAAVDTRPNEREAGGQYGVSISDSAGIVGKYRFLLFDISRTEDRDAFGNTFYTEIDVIDARAREVAEPSAAQTISMIVETEDARITIDTTAASDLTEWAEKELAPVVKEWYPKIVELLPGDGYEAPTRVTITFRDGMRAPAAAGGGRISCNTDWFRRNLKGEAKGSVVHEMVHIVQQYGRARRTNPNPTRNPGWLVEGIADYIRWFLYEPESKGAEITARNLSRARYDGNYRITGNFLNWVTGKYDRDIIRKLNAAAREGRYTEDLWKEYTGHTVQELGAEWRKAHEERLGVPSANTATGPENK